MFGERTFRDRVELKPEEFYRRMRRSRAHPTTSQPTPAEFVRVLRDARAEADEVVAVLLRPGSRARYQARAAGRAAANIDGVEFVDSAIRLARAGHAGPAGRGAGRVGVAGQRHRGGAAAGAGPVGSAPDGGPVRQPAAVGTGDPGQGVDRGMLDVKPILSLDEPGGSFPWTGCGAGTTGTPGAGPAGTAAHPSAQRGAIRRSSTRRPRRWPSGCGPRWWPRTSPGTVS